MSSTKELLNAIGTVVSIITGIIAIAIFLVKGFDFEQREIKIQATNLQDLTKAPKLAGFEAKYSFHNKNVDGVWLLTLNCKNIGNKPIIGSGKKSNLQNDFFLVHIDSNFKILAAQPINNQIQGDIRIADSNSVILKFQKWKPNELLVLQFYIEPKRKESSVYPRVGFNDRDLIECDFSFSSDIEDYFIQHPITKVIKIFPVWSIPFLIGGSLFSIMLCFLPLIGFFVSLVKQKVLYKRWKRDYQEKFNQKIDLLQEEEDLRNKYKNDPSKTPDIIWREIKIQKPEFQPTKLISIFTLSYSLVLSLIGFFNLVVYFAIFFI